MGSMCGAQLAVLDCMRKENEWRKTWLKSSMRLIRFRDDIRIWLLGKCEESRVERRRKMVNSVYGDSLVVEKEGCRDGEMGFLDLKMRIVKL